MVQYLDIIQKKRTRPFEERKIGFFLLRGGGFRASLAIAVFVRAKGCRCKGVPGRTP